MAYPTLDYQWQCFCRRVFQVVQQSWEHMTTSDFRGFGHNSEGFGSRLAQILTAIPKRLT